MRAVRENRDYGSAVRVRYKRLLKMRIPSLCLTLVYLQLFLVADFPFLCYTDPGGDLSWVKRKN